VGNTQIHKTEF